MRSVLLVCPQARDVDALDAFGLVERYDVRCAGPDLDGPEGEHVEVAALLDEVCAAAGHAVVGTKDRSALLAALAAGRLGLPGPDPQSVVSCQHKPTSRAIQRAVAPASTPRSVLLADGQPPFGPPWFVKPVVGRLSQRARRIDDVSELAAVGAGDGYGEGWQLLARHARPAVPSGSGYLVEELAQGDEVTLEGYVRDGGVTVVGVTDARKYAGTNSFERFEYPSALGPDRLEELATLARALVRAHGLDQCFFNVEFLVPQSGPPAIVEVNPRIASQFAPLAQWVHGRSTYDALFALACGDDPCWDGAGARGVAVSYVMRVFEDALVAGVPSPEPGLEILAAPGRVLSEHGVNDAASFRLAIFTEWAETRAEAVRRCRARAERLLSRFVLLPVPAGRGR